MFTASALVAHLVGDYLLQSDWMATTKTTKSLAALAHAVTYTLPFLLLTREWPALLFICSTHYLIDRYRLARYVCWAKNFLAPKWITTTPSWNCSSCGKIDRENVYGEGETCLLCPGVPMVHMPAAEVRNYPWAECQQTGYHRDRPAWLAVWLLIIADNTLHVACNGVALTWL